MSDGILVPESLLWPLFFFFYLNFYDLFVSGVLNFMMKCLVFWGTSRAFSNYRFIFFNSEKISSTISFIASPPLFFVDILFFWNSYFRWQTPKKYTLIFLSFLYFLSVFKKWWGGGGVWLNLPTLLLNFWKHFGYHNFNFSRTLPFSFWNSPYFKSALYYMKVMLSFLYLKLLIITLIIAVWFLFPVLCFLWTP